MLVRLSNPLSPQTLCRVYLVSRALVGDFEILYCRGLAWGIFMASGFSNSAIQEANCEGAPQAELVNSDKLVEMLWRDEPDVVKR
jgi:restriction system protein